MRRVARYGSRKGGGRLKCLEGESTSERIYIYSFGLCSTSREVVDWCVRIRPREVAAVIVANLETEVECARDGLHSDGRSMEVGVVFQEAVLLK